MARPPIFESYSQELPPPGPEMLPVSKPAVFGLLLSILQCLPLVSGVGAIVLGFLGLREIRNGERIGKPIALAAIGIGIVSAVLWIVALTAGGFFAARYAGVYEIGERFTRAAAEGDFEAVRSLSAPGTSDETLALWISELEADGAKPSIQMNALMVDEDDFSLEAAWGGPFTVIYRIDYTTDEGASLPWRQATVTVEIIDGQMRVTDLAVRPRMTLPEPPQPPDPSDIRRPGVVVE